jgi:long-chain acyl-CoA synthetase
VLLVSTYPIFETTRSWPGKVGAVEHVHCMHLPVEDEKSFLALEEIGRENSAPAAEIDAETICGFIYTSGTTGKPKGVLLSHGNITSNINGVSNLFPIDSSDISVSFLPWAHSFGQTCELHFLISRGCAMAIAEAVDKLVQNFAEVKPTILLAVPRVFNRIYDGLQKKMAEEGGLKKALFDAAIDNVVRRRELAAEGKSSWLVDTKHAVLDKLVFSKVRDRFGGRLRFAISGGAALSPEVGQFIDDLGIVVCEGYGLTETSPIVTANHPGARKMGSVGQPIQDVEVIIDKSVAEDEESDDGEIVVKGPNVMKGYHNLPEETELVMTEDGGFRTGDLGRLDDDNFLFITGRIKEQYKLENGKYVVPAPLEELLQLSPFVTQVYIHGANQLYNVALVVPDREAVEKWAKKEGLSGGYEELLEKPETRKLFDHQIEVYAKDFKSYERPKKYELLAEEFTIDNGLLTPKMSLKRKQVVDKYGDLIDQLYAD